MELPLLQFHWTPVNLRVSVLWTEGLPVMQPKDPLIEGKGLGMADLRMRKSHPYPTDAVKSSAGEQTSIDVGS